MTQTISKRLMYLDLFRLVSAISVVIIHVTAGAISKYSTGSPLQFLVTLLNSIALFAVPAFIFISAYGFSIAYHNRKVEIASFLKKRFATLLIPYFLWTLLYNIDQLYASHGTFSILNFIGHLLLGTAFYHLYFMPIIFQFYFLYLPLKYLFERGKPILVLLTSFLLFYIYTKGLPLSKVFPIISQINAHLPLKANLPYTDRFFMSYLPFFTLGIFMGIEREAILNQLYRWRFFIFIAYLVTESLHAYTRIAWYVYQTSPIQIPFIWETSALLSILMLLLITNRLEPLYQNWHTLSKLSAYTFTLYLAHPLILQIVDVKLARIGAHSQTLLIGISFLLAISLPLLVRFEKDRLHSKLKASWWKSNQ